MKEKTLTPLLSTSLHAVRAISPYQDLRCLNPTANNNTSQVTNMCIRSYFKRGLTNKSLLALIVMLTSAQVVETSVTSIELPTIAQVFRNFPQLGDCTTPPTILFLVSDAIAFVSVLPSIHFRQFLIITKLDHEPLRPTL